MHLGNCACAHPVALLPCAADKVLELDQDDTQTHARMHQCTQAGMHTRTHAGMPLMAIKCSEQDILGNKY